MSATTTPAASRIRTRTPIGSAATSAATAAAPANTDGSWMKRGGEARAAAEAEIQKQKEAADRRAAGIYMPFRFYLKYPETKEVIILDHELGPFFYEHSMKNPQTNKWDINESCPKTLELCPICSGEVKLEGAGKESYYVMMLTVMDLTPYTRVDKKTGVSTEVPWSRKLLAVKTADQGYFIRLFDRKGTLRGANLLMARDTKEVSSIGRPELQVGTADDPNFSGFYSDTDLLETFGAPELKDATTGKVIKPANVDCYAFDYNRLFPQPSGPALRRKYHVGGVPGGAADRAAAFTDNSHAGHSHAAPASNQVLDDDIPF